jgi:hypothetical protein
VLIDDPDERLIPDSRFMTSLDGGQVAGDFSHYGESKRAGIGVGYRGEIEVFVDDPRYTYLFADLTPAYQGTKAARVTRSFFFLKPGTFLVADWVTSVKPQSPKRWLLQLPARPTVEGTERVVAGTAEAGIVESSNARLATVTCGKSKLTLQNLAPERALLRRIGGPGYSAWSAGKNWEPPPMTADTPSMQHKRKLAEAASRCWRIEIEPAERGATAVFLNVLDVSAAGAVTPPRAVLVQRGEVVGAAVTRDGASMEILFSADGRARVDGTQIGRSVPPLQPFRP